MATPYSLLRLVPLLSLNPRQSCYSKPIFDLVVVEILRRISTITSSLLSNKRTMLNVQELVNLNVKFLMTYNLCAQAYLLLKSTFALPHNRTTPLANK